MLSPIARLRPISNLDHWGTMLDHWDYPVDGMGDCKIYALFKRKLLIERGFPRQALLMTIVRDLNGEGHAVLTVKTDRGDFVLDNLSETIRPWSATGYQFYKRQAQDDPNVWLSLGGATGGGPDEAATNRGPVGLSARLPQVPDRHRRPPTRALAGQSHKRRNRLGRQAPDARRCDDFSQIIGKRPPRPLVGPEIDQRLLGPRWRDDGLRDLGVKTLRQPLVAIKRRNIGQGQFP